LLRDDVLLKQLVGIVELNLNLQRLRRVGVQSCLIKDRQDLKNQIALLYRLALFDQDLFEIPAL
jgi:hypothetical protein